MAQFVIEISVTAFILKLQDSGMERQMQCIQNAAFLNNARQLAQNSMLIRNSA